MWQWLIKTVIATVAKPVLGFLLDGIREWIKKKQYEEDVEESRKENKKARESLENADTKQERNKGHNDIVDSY